MSQPETPPPARAGGGTAPCGASGRPGAHGLGRLLAPASIALIGGTEAEAVAAQCDRIGYAGELWPVNPRREAIAGRACAPTVDALPGPPDAAFVAVPPDGAVEAVRALAALGCGGAVVHTSGFAEVGAEGARRQAALVEAAGEMALIGPNCWGTINFLDRVALWPDHYGGRVREAGVAIISQSGNLAINLGLHDRSLRIAHLMSVGNQAQTSVSALVGATAADPRVTAIGVVIEALPDMHELDGAVLAARRAGKPVVALKLGSSRLGAGVAISHTASLTGDDRCYQALFDRLGVVRVRSEAALIETLKLLDVTGPLPGRRLLSLTCSGGEATLVADTAERLGLELPALDVAQAARLGRLAGLGYDAVNPFDYHTYVWGRAQALGELFEAAAQAPVDMAVTVVALPRDADADPVARRYAAEWTTVADAFARAVGGQPGLRGAVIGDLPESLPEALRERLLERGIAPLQGIEEALGAIASAAAVGEAWARPEPAGLLQPGPESSGEPPAATTLDEWRSKQMLREAGIAVPEGERVTAGDVPAAAARLGYPVVLKAVSPGLAHKTEAGAVRVGLADDGALREALAAMRAHGPHFLVERCVSGAVAEIMVGVRADPLFGMVMALGSGGVLVEILDDVQTLLLPVTRDEVARALTRLRLAPVLDGFRGRPGADRAALVDAVVAIAHLAEAHSDCLLELDVNPLLATPEGAWAVDALVRMAAVAPAAGVGVAPERETR